MIHICNACNYETYDISHFSRHKKSQKHLAKTRSGSSKETQSRPMKDPNTKSQKYDEIENEDNSCMYCDKIFKHKTHLYRHQKYRCKIKDEQEKEASGIEEMKLQIKQLIEANLNNSKTVLNNSQTVQKSMSTINYVMQNFKDAPPIGLLKGKKLDGFIEYNGNTDRSIQEIIIHYFEKRKLHQLLGDLIVKEYKKENPENQSVWSSDVSRLTFILMQATKNKNNKWIVDKNGVDLTKLVIQPLVEKVIELLRDFVKECNENIQNIDTLNPEIEYETREMLRNMEKANSVIMNIKLKKISMEILKYIAPHFNLKLDQLDDTDSESDDE
jgi:hypothetical protein